MEVEVKIINFNYSRSYLTSSCAQSALSDPSLSRRPMGRSLDTTDNNGCLNKETGKWCRRSSKSHVEKAACSKPSNLEIRSLHDIPAMSFAGAQNPTPHTGHSMMWAKTNTTASFNWLLSSLHSHC